MKFTKTVKIPVHYDTTNSKVSIWEDKLKRANTRLESARDITYEYNTSRKCSDCGSMITTRKWIDGYSYILCHFCGAKIDADFNALRCRDDWLKAGMNMEETHASL
jgi:DNA-directed RNA polymerase subunit RPC12/RpoP